MTLRRRVLAATVLSASAGAAGLYVLREPFGWPFWLSLVLALGGAFSTWVVASLLVLRAAAIWKKAVAVVSLITAVLVASILLAVLVAPERVLVKRPSAQAWREDLDLLVDRLNALHPRPYQKVTREDFTRAVEELRSRLVTLDTEQTVPELMRLVSLLQDGHTIFVPIRQAAAFTAVPIQAESFADGWRVVHAPAHLRDLLGRRIVSVGGMPAEEAFKRLTLFLPHDNEMNARARAPVAFAVPELLQAGGVTDAAGPVVYRLAADDGTESEAELRPVSSLRFLYWLWRSPHRVTEPLYLSHTDDNYWFTLLEPSGTLYLQFNLVRDKPGERFTEFGRRALRAARDHGVRRFVIDLRHNGGGDHTLVREFVEDLSEDDYVNQRGRLYVIIGRHTFSAATTFVTWLEYRTKAIFVGEPTGGRPNHPGDSEIVRLPRSGAFVHISRIFWQHSLAEDDRPSHAPDLPVGLTYHDYTTHRDPVLEAILAHEPEPWPDLRWPRERLQRLEGDYAFDVDEKLSLRAHEGRVTMTVDGFLRLDLHPAGNDRMLTDRSGFFLTFDATGKAPIRAVVLHVHGKTRALERLPAGFQTSRELLEAGEIERAVARLREIRAAQPRHRGVSEGALNRLGYDLLRRGAVKAAIGVFQLNVELYPLSSNTHDSLGEAYLAAGERERAIESYRRSIELNPDNRNAKEVLKRLGGSD